MPTNFLNIISYTQAVKQQAINISAGGEEGGGEGGGGGGGGGGEESDLPNLTKYIFTLCDPSAKCVF